MRTGLYKRLSNEELVELYKAGESDAFEALLKNTEGLRATLAQRYLNIPGSEFEDLMSEGAIEMLSAIQNFDSKNYSSSFSTFLYSAISRHYNDMFTAAVCEKRNPGCFVQSYEQVNSNSEYEEDGDSLGSSEFSVECEDYSMVEIRDKLVGGDFSQIEPRVLAFLSGDESMINAYKEGKDLYAIMGSQVYQLPYEDCREFYPDGTVNAEGKHRRTTMKSVLLGIMYERGATAIGEQFNKSAEWAQQLIDNFYKSFPKINQYRLKIENMAETYGYVTTITGRKRRLPDMQLEDKDDYRYQEAHRQSLNSVIQGSSADIMKLSMIAIYNDPRYKALDCHMIITVHDELIMEVPEDHIKEGAELLVGTMKRVGHSLIDLPMSVDAEVNDYWYGENLAEKYGV